MSFESRVAFLMSGLTNAVLRSFDNILILSDRIIIHVTTGADINTIWKEFGRNGIREAILAIKVIKFMVLKYLSVLNIVHKMVL